MGKGKREGEERRKKGRGREGERCRLEDEPRRVEDNQGRRCRYRHRHLRSRIWAPHKEAAERARTLPEACVTVDVRQPKAARQSPPRSL